MDKAIKKQLDIIPITGNYHSLAVNSVSSDGRVFVGSSLFEERFITAYKKDNEWYIEYNTPNYLANEHSSLNSHEKWTKDRAIRAVSADGKVIGGVVASMITDEGVFADGRQGREIVPITLPAIWRGDVGEWNEKIELLDKPTYDAIVTALNEDGIIAIGYVNNDKAARDDNGYLTNIPTVWRIKPNKPTATPIDIQKTQETINQIGIDSLVVMELERQYLLSLLKGCTPNGFKDVCYALSSNYNQVDSQTKQFSGSLNIAYGLTENLSAGIVFDQAFARQLPTSHKVNRQDVSAGVYAHLRLPHNWFARASVGLSRYDLSMQRKVLNNTEYTTGETSVNGLSASFTVGQQWDNWKWYAGLNHTNITRDAYLEKGEEFPLFYSQLKDKSTALIAGLEGNFALNPKWNVITSLEASYMLDRTMPVFKAYSDGLGHFQHQGKLNKYSIKGGVGLSYKLTPA